MSTPHIRAEHLGKTFHARGTAVTAFGPLDLAIRRNEFFCIIGPSGCGKTSLLRCIAGLDTPSTGTLHIEAGATAPTQLAMVFQEQALFPWMSVRENVRFLMHNSTRVARDQVDNVCDTFLHKVGLQRFAQLYPHEISGGMRQRVSLIRSFAVQPDVLLMDEPFVFVDFQTKLALHELLLRIWQEAARTVVFVTHDIEEAVTLADRILVMSAHPGRIKGLYEVNLPRPRDAFALRKTAAFTALVNTLMDAMHDDMQRDL